MEDITNLSTRSGPDAGGEASCSLTPGGNLGIPVWLRSDFGDRTNVFRGVCEREAGLTRKLRKRPFLGELSCSTGRGAGTVANYGNDTYSPPFAIQFGQTGRASHLLAVGDEDGYVTITDTNEDLPRGRNESEDHRPESRWCASDNSIFDLTWSHDDECLTTVGGDEVVRIWTTETQREVVALGGHTASIKSVSYKPDNENVLASAGRDGAIMIWDLRDTLRGSSGAQLTRSAHKPVATVHNAHLKGTDGGRRARPSRASTSRRRTIKSHPQSVTGLLFLKVDNALASCGSDGKVKFWDVRRLNRPCHLITLPRAPGLSRDYGVTSIAQDRCGTKLAITSFNDAVYLYDCVRPEIGPVATCEGHEVATFYIKLAFSPDGTHLLSGSSDSNAYIWQLDRPEDGAYVLRGHSGEVSGVTWCPTDFGKVATCSDDSTFRVWGIDRAAERSGEGRKIAMPPTVRLRQSLRPARGSGGDYLGQEVETGTMDKRAGALVSETFVDCSVVAEEDCGGGEAAARLPGEMPARRVQQYRNATLDEVWGKIQKDG